uniref:NADH dehydrogenase [ubiquinone] 1 beta subcomplex subunit 3 n=1 Tax=Saimiri boliviensis boliviensis TaxID=39432 RepID=A0A2K6SEP4_SAIBB
MAHGHGHERGHSKMELPDYRQWKIEGTPLEIVQKRLAIHVWLCKKVAFFDVFFTGFKWRFPAFLVAVGAEYYLDSLNKDKKHH